MFRDVHFPNRTQAENARFQRRNDALERKQGEREEELCNHDRELDEREEVRRVPVNAPMICNSCRVRM